MEIKKPNRFYQSIRFPLQFLAFIWIIHIVQLFLPGDFAFLGLYPRTTMGLRGILFAPLIHGDFGHLISNSTPFFVLTTIILFFYRKVAFKSIFMIYFLTGLSVWAFGRSVFHIGLSGVVYGLVSFVFFSGIFRRNLKAIILALVVLVLYSGMFLGVLPNQPGISWESHLLGGIVGIFVAYWFKEGIERDEVRQPYSWELEPEKESALFFERDTFERTKAERQQNKKTDLPDWFSTKTWD